MSPSAIDLITYLFVVVALGAVSLKVRALNLGGVAACIFVGYLILLGGGWYWFLVMLVFFVISTEFTKFRYSYKERFGTAQEKGGARGWPNVLANGGVAAIFSLMEFRFGGGIYAVAFLGAMASATADTLATEIGLLSKKEPRLITDLRKKVPAGSSGGVTSIGTLAALLASLLISVTAMALGIVDASPIEVLAIVTLGGIVGSIADSILGATVQRIGICESCGRITENLRHCSSPTRRLRGLGAIDNNVVNLLSTFIGAFSTVVLFILI
ncbi:MAG: DUF92 domain-containing protein [Nitrososphaerales archaeon]|nr:DUF92 domain-containing protein [Nitrososphaerales archaeon]